MIGFNGYPSELPEYLWVMVDHNTWPNNGSLGVAVAVYDKYPFVGGKMVSNMTMRNLMPECTFM